MDRKTVGETIVYLFELNHDLEKMQTIQNEFYHAKQLLENECDYVRAQLYPHDQFKIVPIELPETSDEQILVEEKVFIPVVNYSYINFIERLLGTKGENIKQMENDTKCKISIRGKGSTRSIRKHLGKVIKDSAEVARITEKIQNTQESEAIILQKKKVEEEDLHVLVSVEAHYDWANMLLRRGVNHVMKMMNPNLSIDDFNNQQKLHNAIMKGIFRGKHISQLGPRDQWLFLKSLEDTSLLKRNNLSVYSNDPPPTMNENQQSFQPIQQQLPQQQLPQQQLPQQQLPQQQLPQQQLPQQQLPQQQLPQQQLPQQQLPQQQLPQQQLPQQQNQISHIPQPTQTQTCQHYKQSAQQSEYQVSPQHQCVYKNQQIMTYPSQQKQAEQGLSQYSPILHDISYLQQPPNYISHTQNSLAKIFLQQQKQQQQQQQQQNAIPQPLSNLDFPPSQIPVQQLQPNVQYQLQKPSNQVQQLQPHISYQLPKPVNPVQQFQQNMYYNQQEQTGNLQQAQYQNQPQQMSYFPVQNMPPPGFNMPAQQPQLLNIPPNQPGLPDKHLQPPPQ